MRTNHQLAKLKAHTLGNIAIFGDSYENGIFSKVNTFGGTPDQVEAARSHSTAIAASEAGLGSGPASAAYFGSDPAFVRREGGIMTSVTTFGNVEDDGDEHPSHMPQYLAGSGGTILAILAGYFALKWTRRI